MALIRPVAALLCGSLAAFGPALAQDAPKAGGDATDKVKEIVEERAAEEQRNDKPEDADVGEAEYNVENCNPVSDDAAESGDAGGSTSKADASEPVESKDLDECENIVK